MTESSTNPGDEGLGARAALVTGAARRIGRTIALELATDGLAVAVHYNGSADEAELVAEEIRDGGGRAVTIQADLSDEKQVRGLTHRVREALGPMTVLVNNASVFDRDTPENATRESWDRHMEINLRAPFVLCQEFLAQLPEVLEGNVINIIDQRVWNLTPHFTTYTLSKTGLWTLTQTLALAFAPRARVNAIGPGPVLPSARQTDEQFIRQWAALPMGRSVTPHEIAEAVRFILDAPSMTGQMIALDGGQHLGWAPEPPDGDLHE